MKYEDDYAPACTCHAFCSCECICGSWDDYECDCCNYDDEEVEDD